MRHSRLTITCLAALALLLRALVPVGWMPNTGLEQHSALMPCPAMGAMMQMPEPRQHPAKHNALAAHDSAFCRYGATAHYAPPSQVPVLLAVLLIGVDVRSDFASAPVVSASFVWDHAARAPPTDV